MRLRTFLVRRAVHPVITPPIVLVLLFVIFRLMPGDPTRFFLSPGQSEQQRNQILVEFGFRHWAPAPGNGFTSTFGTEDQGTYAIRVNVTDSQGRAGAFYYDYVKQIPVLRGRYANVSTEAAGKAPWGGVPRGEGPNRGPAGGGG